MEKSKLPGAPPLHSPGVLSATSAWLTSLNVWGKMLDGALARRGQPFEVLVKKLRPGDLVILFEKRRLRAGVSGYLTVESVMPDGLGHCLVSFAEYELPARLGSRIVVTASRPKIG